MPPVAGNECPRLQRVRVPVAGSEGPGCKVSGPRLQGVRVLVAVSAGPRLQGVRAAVVGSEITEGQLWYTYSHIRVNMLRAYHPHHAEGIEYVRTMLENAFTACVLGKYGETLKSTLIIYRELHNCVANLLNLHS